ncbi:MAG: hypothetical protein JJ899_15515, partial [Alphaproteobacteria bacterium]|nr:hypothetical protein [Alphaproteobacteria bacterium]
LQRELARIAAEIDSVRAELEALETELVTPGPAPADVGTQVEPLPFDIPDSFPGAGIVDPEPVVEIDDPDPGPDHAESLDAEAASDPAPVPVSVPEGDIEAGIRAYEAADYARAYAIWKPLAEAGAALAQFHIGALYFEGRGVPRNLAAARDWLGRALDQGVERARFLLGRVDRDLATTG